MTQDNMCTPILLTPLANQYLADGKSDLESLQELSILEETLQYKFHNRKHLIEALTHNSFVNEQRPLKFQSNERMEYLGDALIGACVAHKLFNHFPQSTEGELSKLRASIVHEGPLSSFARTISLGNFLLTGKGEQRVKAYELDSILSNAFEALIAAIALDANEEEARNLFWRVVARYETENGMTILNLENLQDFDPKSQLQELSMAHLKLLPRYESTLVSQDLFSVAVYFGDQLIVTVESSSKKRGEIIAAQKIIAEKLYLTQRLEKSC